MAIAIHYFVNVFALLQVDAPLPAGSLRLAISTLILIIVVEAVLQSVLAIGLDTFLPRQNVTRMWP